MTTNQDSLDEIIGQACSDAIFGVVPQAGHYPLDVKIILEAKQKILATHIPKSKVEEALKDEPDDNTSMDGRIPMQTYPVFTRNQLRAEIRQKLDLGAIDDSKA